MPRMKYFKHKTEVTTCDDQALQWQGRHLVLNHSNPVQPGAIGKPRALICYFSYTGNTRLAASRLARSLSGRYDVDVVEIYPLKNRRYFAWLVYSLFPDSRAAIKDVNSDVSCYCLICLGVPKWTFNCPIFNEYLRLMTGCVGKRVALFLTFGGFQEKGFIRRIARKIERKGAASVTVLAIKRRNIRNGSYARLIDDFAAEL